MAHMTDKEMKNITAIWNKVDPKQVGGEAVDRLLLAHPWTHKYFTETNNHGSADAISHNAKMKVHGEKVVRTIGEAFKNIHHLKEYYAKLSKDHSKKLNMDPGTFVHFLATLVDVMGKDFHKEFTPEVKASFGKAFGAMADAFAKSYH